MTDFWADAMIVVATLSALFLGSWFISFVINKTKKDESNELDAIQSILDEHQPQYYMQVDGGTVEVEKKECMGCGDEWPCFWYSWADFHQAGWEAQEKE